MKPWQNFEADVASVYQQLGYTVASDVDRNGKQVDLECYRSIPGIGAIKFMVDCKHTSVGASLPSSVVAEFIADYHSLKESCRYQKGVIVSPVPFSRAAKARAAAHGDIELRTFAELRRDLLNASPYLNKMRIEFREYQEAINYIQLIGTVNQGHTEAREALAETLIDEWLSEKDSQHLWLLGDFGSGKTTSLKHQFVRVTETSQDNQEIGSRVPLFIPLRNYANCKSGDEIIERFLSHELGHPIPLRIFLELFHCGEIVLFCDGFDEMGEASDANVRRRNFLMIASLAGGKSKTVISCRPAYFIDSTEFSGILTSLEESDSTIGRGGTGEKINREAAKLLTSSILKKLASTNSGARREMLAECYRRAKIVELKLLSHDQIKEFLQKHDSKIHAQSGGNLNAEKLLHVIADVYDLEDLSSRPILLKLITDTLPWLHEQTRMGYQITRGKHEFVLKAITPSLLYFAYTERELQRELGKGQSRETIDYATKRQLVQLLAYRMHGEQCLEYSRSSFLELLQNFFGSISNSRLEQIDTELRSCSFLTRDDLGSVRFVHKSFLEYFASEEIVSRMVKDKAMFEEISHTALSEEICYFCGDLIAVFASNIIAELHHWRTSSPSRSSGICMINATNILNAGRQAVRIVTNLRGGRLVYKKIKSDLVSLIDSNFDVLSVARSDITEIKFVRSSTDRIDVIKSSCPSIVISDQSRIGTLSVVQADNLNLLTIDSSEIRHIRTGGSAIRIDARNSRLVIDSEAARGIDSIFAASCLLIFSPDVRIDSRWCLIDCTVVGLRLDQSPFTATLERCTLVACLDSSKDPKVVVQKCSGFVLADKLKKTAGQWTRDPRIAYGPKAWHELHFNRLEKKMADYDQMYLAPKRRKLEGLERRGDVERRKSSTRDVSPETEKAISELRQEIELVMPTFRKLRHEHAMGLKEGERLAFGLIRQLDAIKNGTMKFVLTLVENARSGEAFKYRENDM